MERSEQMTADLLTRYRALFSEGEGCPDWAVRKRSAPDQPVCPTVPFVGKRYAQQDVKILVYASAENLAEYWAGNVGHWDGNWLDDDATAQNRHRYCFDCPAMQRGHTLPYVHCSPMEKGGLFTAVMYLASGLRGAPPEHPRAFYETIAFGNYGKFSIETEFQRAVRLQPQLSIEERRKLKSQISRRNIDYATAPHYLRASHAYIRADAEILQPDYIIMPHVKDGGFIDTVKGHARILRIYQMNGTVINNLAPNKRNHGHSPYTRGDPAMLPEAVREAYQAIRGINAENYLYVFGYLDRVLAAEQ